MPQMSPQSHSVAAASQVYTQTHNTIPNSNQGPVYLAIPLTSDYEPIMQGVSIRPDHRPRGGQYSFMKAQPPPPELFEPHPYEGQPLPRSRPKKYWNDWTPMREGKAASYRTPSYSGRPLTYDPPKMLKFTINDVVKPATETNYGAGLTRYSNSHVQVFSYEPPRVPSPRPVIVEKPQLETYRDAASASTLDIRKTNNQDQIAGQPLKANEESVSSSTQSNSQTTTTTLSPSTN